MDTTIFVGLDVHKKTIAVATVEARASADVRFYGTIPNTPEAIRSMLRKLAKGGQRLHLAYEAGPLGYNLYRLSTGLGHRCDVVAPSLIPRKAGDKIKTDRRDAMMLAQLLRAGQLTEVWIPDEAHEAMRDLVRMRAQATKDLRKTRQQLHSFLLRHARVFPGKHWTKAHRRWLGELKFAHPAQHLVLEELLARIERAEELCDRLKTSIVELVPQWTLAPVVAAVQALRGVSILVAATVVAEVGNFSRFQSPRQLMAYLGLNPSEHSSGATIKRGSITKTGNSLARTCLVEAAWTYRHPARVTQIIRERLKGLPEPIRAIAWKAQVRLSARYRKLTAAGKSAPKAIVAVARELVRFIWAIARLVEPKAVVMDAPKIAQQGLVSTRGEEESSQPQTSVPNAGGRAREGGEPSHTGV